MALRICHEKDYLLTPRSPLIRACALVSLYLSSSISTAAQFEELSVNEVNGEYRLRIVALLNVPADYVHNVITDYKHAYRKNPSIIEVKILPIVHNHNKGVRAESFRATGRSFLLRD
jgi:hypothetical protein